MQPCEIDLLKLITLLVGIASLLLGYMTFLSVTLPSKIEKSINDKMNMVRQEYDLALRSRMDVIDLLANILTDSHTTEKDIQLYSVRLTLRLLSQSGDERLKTIRALLGQGKSVAFLVPYIERLRRESSWSTQEETEYQLFLDRLRLESHEGK